MRLSKSAPLNRRGFLKRLACHVLGAITVLVPAAAGPYTIRPHGEAKGTGCATVKAFVRTRP